MNAVLSIIMLAAGALVVGAYLLWRRGAPLKQPLLMLLLAVIAVVIYLVLGGFGLWRWLGSKFTNKSAQ
jgi:hypothetical protein